MNPVSFGSVYKIYLVSSDINKQNKGHSVLGDYCAANKLFTKTKAYNKPQPAAFLGNGEKLYKTTYISALNEYDHDIDMICTNHKIKHEKISSTQSVLKTWNDKNSLVDRFVTYFAAWH